MKKWWNKDMEFGKHKYSLQMTNIYRGIEQRHEKWAIEGTF